VYKANAETGNMEELDKPKKVEGKKLKTKVFWKLKNI